MEYKPLTKAKLIELIKHAPDDAVINMEYQGKGYTANIDVFCELGGGAANQRNIVFLEAKKPHYVK